MTTSPSTGYGYASALRREIIARNHQLVSAESLKSVSSYGRDSVVVYTADDTDSAHGNFHPQSYAAIVASSHWRRRLDKSHSGRRHLPKHETNQWRELDSCTSSDALLMNIFCYPPAQQAGSLHRLMDVHVNARPEFGVRVSASLKNGHRDRTEVDMRFGDLLVEAKLTETDFQCCEAPLLERYAAFEDLFVVRSLPRREDVYLGYQLIRGVLAAHASNSRFCVIVDGRRPDLREQWFSVLQAVSPFELRTRCQILTWQEISAVLPEGLRVWLGRKYGIFASGEEPQLDAADWYW